MALKVYNTLTRKKEVFKSIVKGQVGIYTCGPTVYWYQTIGNLRTYLFEDILKRILIYEGYKVKHIMNVTDVGHLTSDADEGEDKMEKAAAKEGKKAGDIANFYWKVFREDFKKLNILEPNIWCKASEHIKEQIALIEKLDDKGYTYNTSDGIYFDTSKWKDYGKIARLDKENLQAGQRISMGDKKNKTDFALWKFSEIQGKRQQEWVSPWRIGFPGWHIECSAMSMKYLGETFDIHCGGIDHIPVHHSNEIAQSEAATGKKFVNYWIHGNFLTFKGEKVSKSKGGLYTISELQEKNYPPLAYRYLCLLTHYRKTLDFSLGNLTVAKTAYTNLKNKIQMIDKKSKGVEGKKYLTDFKEAIENDMNMPKAIQVLQTLVKDEKISGKSKIEIIIKMDEVFGLDLLKKETLEIPKEIQKLVDERNQARKNKDWEKSDELRDKIKSLGYSIDDTREGTKVRKG